MGIELKKKIIRFQGHLLDSLNCVKILQNLMKLLQLQIFQPLKFLKIY